MASRCSWPTSGQPPEEIKATIGTAVSPDIFSRIYGEVFDGDERWRGLPVPVGSNRYAWDESSTYVARPPFLDGMKLDPAPVSDIVGARALAVLGDSVTTDHISPAGSIPAWSPAGLWLQEHGVTPLEFNSYGARRGHHEVLMRGTFGNIRLRNCDGREGRAVHDPSAVGRGDVHLRRGHALPRRERAADRHRRPEYGSGSSRDWAAKGPALLGVRAVLAETYERIHRTNLVGMGILPLQFMPGQNAASLGLTGREEFDVVGLADGLTQGEKVKLRVRDDSGERFIEVITRLDGPVELDYYRQGGILPAVLRRLAGATAGDVAAAGD